MLISNGRIAEFLSRAQDINEKVKIFESTKPSINPLRSTSNSPIYSKKPQISPISTQRVYCNNPQLSPISNLSVYSKKPQLSPISHVSFTSTYDGTPLPVARKFILSGSFSPKKSISVPPKEKSISKLATTKEKTELPSKRDSISSELPQKKSEKSVETEENTKKAKEIEGKGKKKLNKIVEIFKQEALKTDQKLKSLLEENQRLKEILNFPQLPTPRESIKTVKTVVEHFISLKTENKFDKLLESLCQSCRRIVKKTEDYEKKIPNWFECLQIQTTSFDEFLSGVCRKISLEGKKRLKTEEETGKMIENEEALIRELEKKIIEAESLTSNTSARYINSQFDEPALDREQISANLLSSFQKSLFKPHSPN